MKNKIKLLFVMLLSAYLVGCNYNQSEQPVVEYHNILEVKDGFKEASNNHEIPNEFLCFIGKYRDVYVLSYNGEISAIPEKIWNIGYFTQNLENQYYALYNGELYTLNSLYDMGLLVREDFADIQNKIDDLPLYKVEKDFEFVSINEDIEVCLHEYTYKTIKEASCVENGERHVVCKKCNRLREELTVDMLLHEYQNGSCVKCEDQEKTSIDENDEALKMIQNDREFKRYEYIEFIKGFKTNDNELYVYHLNNYKGKETITTGFLFSSIYGYGDGTLVVVDSKNNDVIDLRKEIYKSPFNQNDRKSIVDYFVNNKEFNEKVYNVRQELLLKLPTIKNDPVHESCFNNINYNLKIYKEIARYVDEFDNLESNYTRGRTDYFLGEIDGGFVLSYVKSSGVSFIAYNQKDCMYQVGNVQITGQVGSIGFVYKKGNKIVSLEDAYKQKKISKKGLLIVKERFEERFNNTK